MLHFLHSFLLLPTSLSFVKPLLQQAMPQGVRDEWVSAIVMKFLSARGCVCVRLWGAHDNNKNKVEKSSLIGLYTELSDTVTLHILKVNKFSRLSRLLEEFAGPDSMSSSSCCSCLCLCLKVFFCLLRKVGS